jgi:DNA-binding NtrC family response regulator
MNEPYVMLVDDEEEFVEALTKRLTHRDVQVIPCFGGEEALDKLDSHRNVDVVILDVKMPGLDGIEVLQEVKKRFPLVEVIMLTGHATVENAVEGMKQGAFDYLMKPCDLEELMEKVEAATAKRREQIDRIREAAVRNALSGMVE